MGSARPRLAWARSGLVVFASTDPRKAQLKDAVLPGRRLSLPQLRPVWTKSKGLRSKVKKRASKACFRSLEQLSLFVIASDSVPVPVVHVPL